MSAWFLFVYSICLHFSSIKVLFLYFYYIWSVYKLLLAARNKHYYNYRFSLASENITFKPFFCLCMWLMMIFYNGSFFIITLCIWLNDACDIISVQICLLTENAIVVRTSLTIRFFLYGLWVTAINTLLSGFFFLFFLYYFLH